MNNEKPIEYQRFEDAARQIFSVPVQAVREQMQAKDEPEDSSDTPEPSESDS
ncbi:MAG: hypothetical protein ACFB0C_06290 [Leptolyngbyaceae cyanobacterium]